MVIKVKRNEQSAEVKIDMTSCTYPDAVKSALVLALELDGYSDRTIREVFGDYSDAIKDASK